MKEKLIFENSDFERIELKDFQFNTIEEYYILVPKEYDDFGVVKDKVEVNKSEYDACHGEKYTEYRYEINLPIQEAGDIYHNWAGNKFNMYHIENDTMWNYRTCYIVSIDFKGAVEPNTEERGILVIFSDYFYETGVDEGIPNVKPTNGYLAGDSVRENKATIEETTENKVRVPLDIQMWLRNETGCGLIDAKEALTELVNAMKVDCQFNATYPAKEKHYDFKITEK